MKTAITKSYCRTPIISLIGAVLISLVTTSAYAQAVGGAFKGLGNNDEPIQIEADNLEVIDDQNTALLTGNVSVVQGATIFRASRIKVYYLRGNDANKSESGIRFIEADGQVAVTAEGSNATSDAATIDMVSEIAVLTGNVIMTQGQNVATGCEVTINLKTSATNIKSCGKKRPTIVFEPKSRTQ